MMLCSKRSKACFPSRRRILWGAIDPGVSDRICFQGLLIRIVTGSAWETVEFLMGYTVSDTTLHARRNEWIAAGVFDRLLEEALAAYDRMIGLDSTHVTIDGSEHTAPCGGQGAGCRPRKRTAVSAGNGVLVSTPTASRSAG